MWCIGKITDEYRQRMHDLLALYAKPYRAEEPVVCLDEKSNSTSVFFLRLFCIVFSRA